MSLSPVALAALAGILAGIGLTVVFLWAASYVPWRHRPSRPTKASELERGLLDTLATIDVPIVFVDSRMTIVAASDAAQSLAMLSSDHVSDPELVLVVREAFASRQGITRQVDVARGPYGDASIAIEVRAVRLSKKRVLLYLADRSDLQRLEEVRRDFMANVSHELKTPIGAITLLAEAIDEAATEPQMVKNFAARLTGEAERLAVITQEIIELSRLQAEGAVSDFSPVDVSSVIAMAVDQHRVEAESHRVTLKITDVPGLRVLADEPRLVMAVGNLLSNAIRYSPEGSPVDIRVRATKKKVEISVTDHGMGMTRDESERVFERFYRTDQARSRATGGTGLGLSIVKHVVAHHGGDVRLTSAPGEGSTFTLRLPRLSETRMEAETA